MFSNKKTYPAKTNNFRGWKVLFEGFKPIKFIFNFFKSPCATLCFVHVLTDFIFVI